MHKSLNKYGLASAALALAMTPSLGAAQNQAMPETPATTGTPPTGTPPTATPPVHTPGMPHSDTTTESTPDPTTPMPGDEQTADSAASDQLATQAATPPVSAADRDAKMQAWPAEQRTAFNTCTPETQTYFWTLSEDRQEIFWRIADTDKATLATMAEPQREATWVELENRIKTMKG
ncbi:MAG: hypothetical protein O9293_04475 [Porphyrobacter sp.]|nr:hypothetical protein [Porphyrobacter sp.]